jgi:glycine/D-amino acid oxidase-like deaminating enzyme
MNASDERSRSLWMDTVVAEAPPLTQDKRVDTVVVGSGIAGLATAYELVLRGQKVAVLDRGRIAGGMTARTTAHLTPQSDDGFKTVIEARGLDGAKTFYQSHAAAVDRIEAIQRDENIACHFRRVNGYLFPAIGKDPAEELTPEFEATKKVRMPIERHTGLPFKGLGEMKCLRYPNLATFHPLRYLRGVADAIVRRGGELFADTTVTAVEEKGGAVTVRTANGPSVQAANAVVATNSPINDRFTLHTKLAPYRTYAMALTIEPDSIEDALYWDTLDPYHYVRRENGRGSTQYLIVGGADHKTGETDDGWVRFEGLESWIRGLLPQVGNVTHRWSGQVLDPIDYAAFIGVLRSRALCLGWGQELHRRERHRGEEFRRIHRPRGAQVGRRVEARAGRDHPRRTAQGRGLPRRQRQGSSRVGGVHACRLSPALEFLGALLGLHLPRFAFRDRRHRP